MDHIGSIPPDPTAADVGDADMVHSAHSRAIENIASSQFLWQSLFFGFFEQGVL